MHKQFNLNSLSRVVIVGVGLLGGSIGLALRAVGYSGKRIGVGRRASSLKRALSFDAVDEVTRNVREGVDGADLVILCTPLGRFEELMTEMAGALSERAFVTDVGSAKREVVATAERLLSPTVRFVGSHPMAGSEKAGVEFARADLFERALCLVTPGARSAAADVRWVQSFWEAIGGRTLVLSPDRHDELLAVASHLPHAAACALVHLAEQHSAMGLAGPGFGDTTRIASGEPKMWVDIFRSNCVPTTEAVKALIAELESFRRMLERDDAEALEKWLNDSKAARDRWVREIYKKKVLPP